MEKAEAIQKSYILSHVKNIKYNFFTCENITFQIYRMLYLINISLYFITWYIIKTLILG